jgi:UDP-N-acetylmuramoyl-tripeptide--D-alanyl-D-alanine ligase
MQNFPNGLDQVAEEEFTLAQGSKVMVVNADAVAEKYCHRYLAHHRRLIIYSLVHDSGQPPTPHLLGHMRLPALAAAAVAGGLGLTAKQIAAGLAEVRPVAGRMNSLPGTGGSTIIDDTYNSSPDAVAAALQTLAAMPTTGRRIAILGSMNELGTESARYHREAGAAAAGLDLLVTLGTESSKYLGPAAVAAGLDPTRWRAADTPYAAGEYLKLLLQPGDLVLAKGSQNGVFAEEAVKLLLANPADASKLVRQSPTWLKTKAKQFPQAPTS